jgi:hypothetical protein
MESQTRPSNQRNSEPPTEAQGGYEKSAERDAKSDQAPGKHSREVELKIAENMPDRK